MSQSDRQLIHTSNMTDNVIFQRNRSNPKLNAAILDAYKRGLDCIDAGQARLIAKNPAKQVCYARSAILADAVKVAKSDAASPCLSLSRNDQSALTEVETSLIVLADTINDLIGLAGQDWLGSILSMFLECLEEEPVCGETLSLLASGYAPKNLKSHKPWERREWLDIAERNSDEVDC